MAQTRKVLGQAAPAAATPTDLYPVPGATSTTVSSIMVANRGPGSATFKVSVRVGGAGASNEQIIYPDITINENDTFKATLGMTLAATDVVTVEGSTANLSFNLFGIETT